MTIEIFTEKDPGLITKAFFERFGSEAMIQGTEVFKGRQFFGS